MAIVNDDEFVDSLYHHYRSYVEHENHLVNFRTTWLIGIEGATMIAFGWTLHAMSEVLHDSGVPPSTLVQRASNLYEFYLYLLAFTGWSVAIVAGMSIRAALGAIRKLEGGWRKAESEVASNRLFKLLPHITGAERNSWESKTGHIFAKGLPWLFLCIVWPSVAIFLVVNFSPLASFLRTLPNLGPVIKLVFG